MFFCLYVFVVGFGFGCDFFMYVIVVCVIKVVWKGKMFVVIDVDVFQIV